MHWRDVVCGQTIPSLARAALGFSPECPGRRHLLQKLTPPNPFGSVLNREAIAKYFEANNQPKAAAAIRRPSEVSCLGWVHNVTDLVPVRDTNEGEEQAVQVQEIDISAEKKVDVNDEDEEWTVVNDSAEKMDVEEIDAEIAELEAQVARLRETVSAARGSVRAGR
eukprot:FR738452.1.p1 GENE.FR738452.1~~FR738452.1.p1  ORF type:complete len:193 (+),score=25.22 FR738452.1:82-579(+)